MSKDWQNWDDEDERWFDMNGNHVDDLGTYTREQWVTLNKGYKRPIEGIEAYPVEGSRIKAKRTILPEHPLWDFLEQESYNHWAQELIVELDSPERDFDKFDKYAMVFVNHVDDMLDRKQAAKLEAIAAAKKTRKKK